MFVQLGVYAWMNIFNKKDMPYPNHIKYTRNIYSLTLMSCVRKLNIRACLYMSSLRNHHFEVKLCSRSGILMQTHLGLQMNGTRAQQLPRLATCRPRTPTTLNSLTETVCAAIFGTFQSPAYLSSRHLSLQPVNKAVGFNRWDPVQAWEEARQPLALIPPCSTVVER